MASQRHLSRIAVIQTLFAYEFRGGELSEVLAYMAKEFTPKLQNTEFASELVTGINKNLSELHRIIEEHAPEWPIEKIARIDRAILELGVFELKYRADIPPVVSINEAIEVAKDFGEVNASKFINGVLSSVMKAHCKNTNNDPKENGA